ncbi:class I SAM-dependent DNA methyltransferase [Roseiterribacter gracilis]|uniref:Methyltransferase n=1 Tax=Roseiterribacter gracilis TaxID=2812848 RepID=A0A8S8X9C5_9PROT|nr:methyltransferase [Rhodospirillales bacterium TMPK1]
MRDSPQEIQYWRDRLLLDPRDLGAMLRLAGLAQEGGDLAGAIEYAQRALRVDPEQKEALFRLGELWAQLGDSVRAAERFERLLAIDPEDRFGARDALAALPEAGTPTEAYVRILFDQYASKFDTAIAALDYRAPQLVASLALRALGAPRSDLDLLDLGCGTGLSGVALHPWARRIDGVDLSPAMIEAARARRLYDRLAVDDVQRFLETSDARWDVIAAVDTLNYLGPLTPIFTAIAAHTDRFLGTVERADDEMAVVLRATRRYAHGQRALEQAASAAGWRLTACESAVLRTEATVGVTGFVFSLER